MMIQISSMKSLFVSTSLTLLSIFIPCFADTIYRTGENIYGGNSYNWGEYETAGELDQDPWSEETIQNAEGELYDCDSWGICHSRGY